MKDKNVITSGKRLTELLISAAQKILCNQFPAINGLQPTVYQQKYSLPQTKDSIQIVHVRNNHWAVVTTIGNTDKEENVVR